jgi:predicted NBD/HSP70 family sugar kinase
VSNGQYILGAHGYAGEIGHTTVEPEGVLCGCGNRGCLETVASDRAWLKAISERLGENVTFPVVQALWAQGNPVVREEVERALGYVAIGLASVVNLFNPRVIYVNGRIFGLGSEILTLLSERVHSRALKPSFADVQIRTTTGDKMHGAITGLLDHVFAEVGPVLR